MFGVYRHATGGSVEVGPVLIVISSEGEFIERLDTIRMGGTLRRFGLSTLSTDF